MRALRSSFIAVLCAVALICSMAAATPPAYNYAGKFGPRPRLPRRVPFRDMPW